LTPWSVALVDALAREGIDIGALGLAWARVMPSIAIVPAFGLRAMPPPARAALGLAFAATILPAVAPMAKDTAMPWVLLAVGEAARGLPVAVAAAVPLWAATMAGGVADALRAAADTPDSLVVEGRATTLGIPLSLLASSLFLASGQPARVAKALALHPVDSHPLLAASHDLVAGITLAMALGGPLLAAGVVIEIAAALVARAASPAQVHGLLAPLRALGMLGVMAIVLDRLAAVLSRAIASGP
jgi:type III secretory pathway component EscT